METTKNCILTINSGSSSIKFALYEYANSMEQLLYGELESIGEKIKKLTFTDNATHIKKSLDIGTSGHDDIANFLIDRLEKQEKFSSIGAIGHRLVQGMKHTQPELLTPGLVEELKKISPYDPEHLPGEIKLIEAFRKRHPALPQVACFDTSFHTHMPPIAKLLSIPRRYNKMGIQRYGFHGLSYAYLLEELIRLEGVEKAKGRIILAHLGNGASLAALKDGKSMDTSMGFTPASGLPMGTRTGDIDPGVAWYLIQKENLSPDRFSHLINHQSGLLGVSEISSDMRELIKCEHTDSRAAEAIELFCYQTKKWIGSFAAALGGIDTLVFSGGIGENAAEIRTRICDGLSFLGIELDEKRNAENDAIISEVKSRVCVRVIKTNEELMIARMVFQIMDYSTKKLKYHGITNN